MCLSYSMTKAAITSSNLKSIIGNDMHIHQSLKKTDSNSKDSYHNNYLTNILYAGRELYRALPSMID